MLTDHNHSSDRARHERCFDFVSDLARPFKSLSASKGESQTFEISHDMVKVELTVAPVPVTLFVCPLSVFVTVPCGFSRYNSSPLPVAW